MAHFECEGHFARERSFRHRGNVAWVMCRHLASPWQLQGNEAALNYRPICRVFVTAPSLNPIIPQSPRRLVYIHLKSSSSSFNLDLVKRRNACWWGNDTCYVTRGQQITSAPWLLRVSLKASVTSSECATCGGVDLWLIQRLLVNAFISIIYETTKQRFNFRLWKTAALIIINEIKRYNLRACLRRRPNIECDILLEKWTLSVNHGLWSEEDALRRGRGLIV